MHLRESISAYTLRLTQQFTANLFHEIFKFHQLSESYSGTNREPWRVPDCFSHDLAHQPACWNAMSRCEQGPNDRTTVAVVTPYHRVSEDAGLEIVVILPSEI